MIHMHQNGTANTMCGLDLSQLHGPCVVGWQEADQVTCDACLSPEYDVSLDPISPDFDPQSWS